MRKVISRLKPLAKLLKFSDIFKSETYPSLRLRKIFSITVEKTYPPIFNEIKSNPIISFIDNTRVLFWSFIARQHDGFECCYYKKYKESENIHVKKMQENGFVVINDFISDANQYLKIKNECLELKDKLLSEKDNLEYKNNLKNLGYHKLKPDSYEIINEQLNLYTKELFRTKTYPKIFANLQISKNPDLEIDNSDATVHWHADRFIPCVNAQYYPFGCDDWMPTQRIIKSPYIDGIEGAKKLQVFYRNLNDLPDKKPSVFTPVLNPNTLILAFHHVYHRKAPIKSSGERFMIFITHYNTFTKRNLIKSAIKKLFHINSKI